MAKSPITISCEHVMESVRSSNLNFSCKETPYSLYITIRKSLTKVSIDSNCWRSSSPIFENEDSMKRLVEENNKLKQMLENCRSDLESSEELLKLSETRTEAGQVKLSKRCQEVQHCIEVMKKKIMK